MEFSLLDSIRFYINRTTLAHRLHIRPGSPDEEDFWQLVNELEAAARPKALYKIAFIESRGENSITLDGIEFHSRILCVNLLEVHRVFAFVATCGVELAALGEREVDLLRQFWADNVMEEALRAAMEAMHAEISTRYRLGKTSMMNPGSLADWPIHQQIPFFQLLGTEVVRTGVQLTESLLMVPAKSVTGLIFETDSGFTSCQLCPRKVCPNRRADYDPSLMEEKYRRDTNPR